MLCNVAAVFKPRDSELFEGGREGQIRKLGLTYTHHYIYIYSQQGPAGNYTQYFVIICKRKESEKESVLCNWITVLCTRNYQDIVSQLYFNIKILLNPVKQDIRKWLGGSSTSFSSSKLPIQPANQYPSEHHLLAVWLQECRVYGDELGDWDWQIHTTMYKIDN